MEKIFKKATTRIFSIFLMGMMLFSFATAGVYPDHFIDNGKANVAIVIGANAAPADNVVASNIAAGLSSAIVPESLTTLTGAIGVAEDEVVLGNRINATGSKIEQTLTDGKIESLLDKKISWNDGSGTSDYDVHEEIVINGDMTILTSLDDEELDGVALSNNKALEYRYVFDDAINTSALNAGEGDTLYLTILGEKYEVSQLSTDSITVVTSDEVSLSIGESITVDGKTFTVNDIFKDKAQINGEIISEGSTETVGGFDVKVDTVGYHSYAIENSKVILKIGKDLSKTYSDGEEYIGEDEDEPLWVWTISNPTVDGGHIGVRYNVNINDADDEEAGDTIKYVNDSYVMPNNFAEVKLEGLTDVDYEDVTIEFAEKDLYNSLDSATANEDAKVIVISAETTSSILVGDEETDEIYIYYAKNGSETNTGSANGAVEVFYRDHDGDNTPTNKVRFELQEDLNVSNELARTNIATIEVGDTTMDVDVTVAGGIMTLSFENPDAADIDLTIGGDAIAQDAGTLERLGATAEDADNNDIVVNGTDVSHKEESIMDYYGTIIGRDDSSGVEGNADEDEVTLSIPSDKVYAEVSVKAGGAVVTTEEDAGVLIVRDNAIDSVAGKNLIVIGGSCINSLSESLLGGKFCGTEFTSKTGVSSGKALIQTFSRSNGTVATIVAGFTAEDTTRGVDKLMNSNFTITAGKKDIV